MMNKKQISGKGEVSPQNYNKVSVFLSYSREDEKEINIIKKTLNSLGIPEENIFIDTQAITPGEKSIRTIRKRIENANLCMFLWTNNIEDSSIIASEREHAHELLEDIEFIRKGKKKLGKDLSLKPYKVIDIIGEKLTPELRERLDGYGTQYIRIEFDEKKELERKIDERMKKVLPLLREIQKSSKVPESGDETSISKERIIVEIEKLVEIASRYVDQHKYEEALDLYREAEKESRNKQTILEESEKREIEYKDCLCLLFTEEGIKKQKNSIKKY